ncbi:WW domain-containing oxidoreductase-like [Saccostrea echinata]|uniref:WW domain-containing oxidoreductase-like n=1 Tax=Saccostrea echinata TaxID=191078 RepID=UPI002A834375|nr:WW domain-containing oxidoreductase-like [Saccostrea echinata]
MGGSPSFPRETLSSDKIVIVTGGNTGIGYETAKWIAMLGAHVIIACRSKDRAMHATTKMKADFEDEKKKGTPNLTTGELSLEFMELDLSSLNSTEKFIEEFKASGKLLHVLICNAGLGMHPLAYTEDGNEMMFQVNYLGHFLIIVKLLPVMLRSGSDCRIVLVSSIAHKWTSFDLDKIQAKQYNEANFDRADYYYKSKLYQVMQMYCLNRRIDQSNVTVNSLHPGVVDSEFTRSFRDDCSWTWRYKCAKCIGLAITPYKGAITSIDAAINRKHVGLRDIYFDKCTPANSSSEARNVENQEQLWWYSLNCLQGHLKEEDLQIFSTKS